MTVSKLRKLARDQPNLRTIKVESQPPGKPVAALASSEPLLNTLVGSAGLHSIETYERGAVGMQPGCSVPERHVELDRRWQRSDEADARELHQGMLPYLSDWMQHVELIIEVEKTISLKRGWLDASTVRAPGWEVDASERHVIDRFFEDFRSWLEA